MKKLKVACFRYRKHNDVYVNNVSFSTDALLSILDVFPDKKIIVLIEADENYVQTLSLIGKSIGIAELMSHSRIPRFSVACKKMELRYLLNQVNIDNLEGMFIAGINDDIIPEDIICSLDRIANSIVKNGISDISVSIDFPENQVDIAFSKEKYDVKSVKDRIRKIFGD